jgi:uncharacterized protein YecE (DUF72 family)
VNARLHIGTSSWNYKDWIGPFYPPGTKPADMVAFYSTIFPSVEVDASYYGIPRATAAETWKRRSSEGFTFSFKTPSAVTHERRFVDTGAYFAAFVARVRSMGAKAGAILIQCPPDFAPTREARAALFGFLETELPGDIPVALELRDPRWFDQTLYDFARAASFTLALTEGTHSTVEFACKVGEELINHRPAPHAYVRWLGEQTFPHYGSVQSRRTQPLDRWEELIRSLGAVCTDIYAYASNDYEGYAPDTVRSMLARLGEPAPPPTGEVRLL